MTAKPAMTRTQIIETAKQIVMYHGPANALEFTSLYVCQELMLDTGDGPDADEDPRFAPVYAETRKQAIRVYHFLGYEPPAGWAA